MKDIIIEISKETRMVNLSQSCIGVDNENLQGNLVFKFTDEFVEGAGRLDFEIEGKKNFTTLEKDGESYKLPIKNVLTKVGQINMQLIVTENEVNGSIPVFKSNVFYVRVNKSINATSEAPDGYEEWLDVANEKLAELIITIDNSKEISEYAKTQGDYAKEQGDYAKEHTLDYEERISKLESEVVEINEEQTTQNENISNNASSITEINGEIEAINNNIGVINGNIQTIEGNITSIETTITGHQQEINTINTSLEEEITNRENEDINLQEQIDGIVASSDVKDIVGTYQELLDYDTSKLGNNDIVKVLQDNTHEDAMTYYRWLTTSSEFEYIGQEGPYYTKSEIDTKLSGKVSNSTYETKMQSLDTEIAKKLEESDLNDYVKNTDYASGSKGGVIKSNDTFSVAVSTSTGSLYASEKTYSQYTNGSANMFISKGTLENVITGKDLATKNDIKEYVDSLNANEVVY